VCMSSSSVYYVLGRLWLVLVWLVMYSYIFMKYVVLYLIYISWLC